MGFALVWIARNQVFDHFKFQRFFPLGVILVEDLPIVAPIQMASGMSAFYRSWLGASHPWWRTPAVASVLIVMLVVTDAAIMGVLVVYSLPDYRPWARAAGG